MPRKRKQDDTPTLEHGAVPEVEVQQPLAQGADLERYVDRLVNLHEEKRDLAESIKEVLSEAEGQGFNKKALLVVVKRRLETATQTAEREAVEEEVERMLSALGSFSSTPLGEAAIGRTQGNA